MQVLQLDNWHIIFILLCASTLYRSNCLACNYSLCCIESYCQYKCKEAIIQNVKVVFCQSLFNNAKQCHLSKMHIALKPNWWVVMWGGVVDWWGGGSGDLPCYHRIAPLVGLWNKAKCTLRRHYHRRWGKHVLHYHSFLFSKVYVNTELG